VDLEEDNKYEELVTALGKILEEMHALEEAARNSG
jgi:hypothetical protein